MNLAQGMTRTQQLLADDPIWLILLKVVALFALGVVLTLFMINWERKVVGRMQQRPGPNRVGPGGWLQSLADGLKLAFKEDIMPVMADKRVYFIAPVISTIPAFVAFSVIPFGGEVSIFGEPTVLQLVDLPVGVLVVLACSLDRRLRHRARRLGVRLAVPAAGGAAQGGAGDLLRDRAGAVDRRRDPLRRLAVHRGHRGRAGGSGWYVLLLVAELRRVRDRDGRRDQPGARSTCRRPSRSWSAASTPSTRR